MLILNKHNFFFRVMHKDRDSSTAPKTTFYPDLKICFVLNGEAVWEIEDRVYTAVPGDVFFLNVGQRRCFTSFGKDGFDLAILNLTRSVFSELHHYTFFRERVSDGKSVIRDPMLFSILSEIHGEWTRGFSDGYELASVKLSEFFIKAERLTNFSFDPTFLGFGELLDQMDEIDDAVTGGVRLKEIAHRLGMTESTFSRRFYALNGVPFQQYVAEKKMQHALHLLKTTDMKILDVALESGFNSISGFYAAFRKHFGTTPGKLSWQDV